MEIVTGSTGQVHVTSVDDAVRNGNPGYLNSRVVLTVLQNFSATIVTNNQVRINSGYGMNQGRLFKIDNNEFDLVTIENGSQGYKRADLIVARYTMDTQTGFEDISLVAIKGNSGNSYVDPTYSTGNINQGATQDDMPLYRVKLNGLVIEAVERMFTLIPDGGRLGQLEAKVTAHMNAFNALNFRTNLASEATAMPKNGANVRPGVEGTLGASHGGTGQTTLKAAGDSIISNLGDNNTTPTDATVFVGSTPNTSGFQKKTMASLWTYLTEKIRTLLGLTTVGSNTDVVPIAHGGTGKASITPNNVLVGNAGGGFDEWGVDSAPSSSSDKKLITSKGVADALGSAGYGDMLKSTYDPNSDGIIDITQGGTGANTVAGARNALNLGNTDGAVPIANGGTGATSVATARNNLKLGNTEGPVPIANGGTGLSASPSMLTNLGSSTAANVLQASPRPGITGTLAISHGGTGATTAAAARNALGLGNTTGALPVANGGTGATSASAARTNLGAMSSAGGTFSGNVAVATAGTGRLALGNSTPSTDPSGKGSQGLLRIYHHYDYYADLTVNSAMTSKQTFYLPKSGGTLVTTAGLEGGAGSGGAYTLTAGGSGSKGNVVIYGSESYGKFTESLETLAKARTYSIPNASGIIQVSSTSSRRVKENIHDMTEERAKKLLDLDVVNFDYIGEFGGGLKDQSGVIAEDAIKVIPEAVLIPKKYDETKPVDEEKNPAPSVDYRQYIPYLIKMVQIQQKEIEELKAALNK